MVKRLPTHIFSTHFLVLCVLATASTCYAHEGEATGLFDLIATQQFEPRGDGVDSHVLLCGSLDGFRTKVADSRLPVVVQLSNDNPRVWGGFREQYQNLASDFAGKVLFVSVNAQRADALVKRFMGLFLQLALQAKAKTDNYSKALQHRLGVVLSQLVAMRKGDVTQRVYLFFRDGHLIIPQTHSYETAQKLRGDVHKQLLAKHRAHVLKVPSPWQRAQGKVPALALHLTSDLQGIAKRLHVKQVCSNK